MPTLSADFLASIPIFKGMSEQERNQILQVMIREKYEPGEDVIKPGDRAAGLHVVLEGTAEVVMDVYGFSNPMVEDGQAQVVDRTKIATLEIGATFGEVSFFSGGEHTAIVRATSTVELLTLPEDAYRELLSHESLAAYKLALNAAHILAERVRYADKLIGELVMAKHDSLARADWYATHSELYIGSGGAARFLK
jgi:CRP-like cAMP-binding protein